MSPIFVRPVREQFEHDRLIRFLHAKYKRRAPVVAMNIGDEQTSPVKLGSNTYFPDLVLWDGKKLAGLVEVESGESVNNLEAMAQWVHFARAKTPFHLYVPVPSFEVARRLCGALGARVTELWTYRPTHDGFDLVRMAQDPAAPGAMMATSVSAPEKPEKPEKIEKVEKAERPVKAVAKTPPARKPAGKPATKAPAPKKAVAKKPAPRKAATKVARPKAGRAPAKAAPKTRKATRKR